MFEDRITWLIAVGLLIVGALAVFRRRRRWHDERSLFGRRNRGDIDHAELEQAEREVQEAPDEDGVRDWGPGTHQPPVG